VYDIKHLMQARGNNFNGGLNDLADMLQVVRIGPQHQAGSDSLLTGQIFFEMRQRYFEGKIDDALYLGQVWGLNGNGPAPLTNGTAGSNGTSSNAGGAPPNPPKTPTTNGNQQSIQGTPDSGTPARDSTPGTPGFTGAFGKLGM